MQYSVTKFDFDVEKLAEEICDIGNNEKAKRSERSNKNGGVQIRIKDNWFLVKEKPYLQDFCYSLKQHLKAETLQIWLNLNYPGSYNVAHHHGEDESWYSGVYYVKVPEDSGDLVFTLNDESVTPKEKDLILFHSSVYHGVEPNLSEDVRISLAFNYRGVA